MIKSIGHLAFGVKDIGKSLEFYCGVLGFSEMFRMSNPKRDPAGVYIKVAHEQYLELFVMDEVANGPQQSYKHMCLHVEDIEGVVEDIQRKGWSIDHPIKMGGDGNLQAWITDPDGNRIEFMQLHPDSKQRKADP
ncbi:MAG TPA: VOC family protein [Clostridiales bacterium]|nr:VOC family protein [Clostridiales bacterium]